MNGYAVKTAPTNGEIYTVYKINILFHQKVIDELVKYGEYREVK